MHGSKSPCIGNRHVGTPVEKSRIGNYGCRQPRARQSRPDPYQISSLDLPSENMEPPPGSKATKWIPATVPAALLMMRYTIRKAQSVDFSIWAGRALTAKIWTPTLHEVLTDAPIGMSVVKLSSNKYTF
jgi:hypothetical protein